MEMEDILLLHKRAVIAVRLWRQDIDIEIIIETAEEVFGKKEAEIILRTAQNYL